MFDDRNDAHVRRHLGATPGKHHSINGVLEGVIELTEASHAPWRFRKGNSFVAKPGCRGVGRTIATVRTIYLIVN